MLIVSYEDRPVRLWHRIRPVMEAHRQRGIENDRARQGARYGTANGDTLEPLENVHVLPDPAPLFVGDSQRRGAAKPGYGWHKLWAAAASIRPSLVVIDPATAALADVNPNDSTPVRAFMGHLARASEQHDTGVLVVAHDTKASRDEVKNSGSPGAGAVAGSATWYDAARSVLYLARDWFGHRVVECIKCNHGICGWGSDHRGRYAALQRLGSKAIRRIPSQSQAGFGQRLESGGRAEKRAEQTEEQARGKQSSVDSGPGAVGCHADAL